MSAVKYEKFKNGCEIAVSENHTFGTDAFLLADFAAAKHNEIVCDLGTGCGIIAVLIKMRYEPNRVYGIEIQPEAAELFRTTVERSGLENVFPINMDLRELKDPAPLGVCGLVTCNPPYKAAGSGIESGGNAQKIARHEIMCGINDVCRAGAKLLKFGGRLCICNRPERLADVVCAMRENGIEPKKIRFVSKTPKDPPWLFLIEGRKGGKPFMNVMPPLFMSENGGISEELRSIYGHTLPEGESIK